MKPLLLVGAGLLVTSASICAQTAPSTTNGIPNTALSTSTEPSNGPRSRQADLPTNNAAAAIGGGVSAPTTVVETEAGAPPVVPVSPSVGEALPAPAPLAQYPMCSAGQFDQCMEPGNGTETRPRRMSRRHARR